VCGLLQHACHTQTYKKKDGQGRHIGVFIAVRQGEWMQTEFVFEVLAVQAGVLLGSIVFSNSLPCVSHLHKRGAQQQ
jgi:hypothetical protein